MKADIKLPLYIPIVASILSIVVVALEFNLIDIIIITGALLIITYFVLGYVKRKDALIIENDKMVVVTPIKRREYDFSLMTNLDLVDGNSILKCSYPIEDEIKNITLCSNIYTEKLDTIYEYLCSHHPELKK